LIQSRATRRFWRLFRDLPAEVQRDARNAYRIFKADPAHPSLQFKKLAGEDRIYSIRIGLGYRALAVTGKEHMIWYWIGSHATYNRLV
jgi:hypothetical protein